MDKSYRLLEKGETIRYTDEYLSDMRGWIETKCSGDEAPDPAYTSHRQYRRRLES